MPSRNVSASNLSSLAKGVIFKLLGAFAKLRKATIGFVISVRQHARPSVRMEKLGPHWMDFNEKLYLSI